MYKICFHITNFKIWNNFQFSVGNLTKFKIKNFKIFSIKNFKIVKKNYIEHLSELFLNEVKSNFFIFNFFSFKNSKLSQIWNFTTKIFSTIFGMDFSYTIPCFFIPRIKKPKFFKKFEPRSQKFLRHISRFKKISITSQIKSIKKKNSIPKKITQHMK